MSDDSEDSSTSVAELLRTHKRVKTIQSPASASIPLRSRLPQPRRPLSLAPAPRTPLSCLVHRQNARGFHLHQLHATYDPNSSNNLCSPAASSFRGRQVESCASEDSDNGPPSISALLANVSKQQRASPELPISPSRNVQRAQLADSPLASSPTLPKRQRMVTGSIQGLGTPSLLSKNGAGSTKGKALPPERRLRLGQATVRTEALSRRETTISLTQGPHEQQSSTTPALSISSNVKPSSSRVRKGDDVDNNEDDVDPALLNKKQRALVVYKSLIATHGTTQENDILETSNGLPSPSVLRRVFRNQLEIVITETNK